MYLCYKYFSESFMFNDIIYPKLGMSFVFHLPFCELTICTVIVHFIHIMSFCFSLWQGRNNPFYALSIIKIFNGSCPVPPYVDYISYLRNVGIIRVLSIKRVMGCLRYFIESRIKSLKDLVCVWSLKFFIKCSFLYQSILKTLKHDDK